MKIDKECRILCEALNKIKGINTIESCCGHGKKEYNIWFRADNLDCLPDLLYWFDSCHCGYYGWTVIARTDCGKNPTYFNITRKIGKEAYEESKEIARLIIEDQRDINK